MARTTREARTRQEASGSANALNRAIGYLNAAIIEIDQAHAHADAAPFGLEAREESALLAKLSDALLRAPADDPAASIFNTLRKLRDRRAARAGFSFDEEN